MSADMLSRSFRAEESRARYWAQQAVELCSKIEDESLAEFVEPVLQADKALNHDRRIIVFGGAQCGKSSLLAAVAGTSLPARVPLAGDYVCWRYRSLDGDARASRFIPLENLEGLELVDSANCAEEGVAASVRKLLAGADVIIAVADGRTAETSPVWQLLAELPEEQHASCLVAVTFTDKMVADTALELKEKLREFCRERLGRTLPLYFVNPTTGEESMESFVLCVQDTLAAPGGVRRSIRHLVECAKELVRKQGSVLGARDRVARTDSGFLAGIEQEIDYFLSRQREGVQGCLDAYSEAAMRALPTTVHALRAALGWILSPVTLIRMESYAVGTEKFFYRTLRSEILDQQETSDANFVLSCMKHWQSVRPRMKKTLECDIGEFPADALAADLAELRVRMGRELYKPFSQMKLRTEYGRVFLGQIWWMCLCCAGICLLLFMAGIFGALGMDFPAWCALGMSGAVWIIGSLLHILAARGICRDVVLLSLDLQKNLKSCGHELIENLLVSRVSAYRRLYMAPREKVARQESNLKPLQQRQKEINMQLNAAAPRL